MVFHFTGKTKLKKDFIITIQEEDIRWWITNASSVLVKQTNTASGLAKEMGKTENILMLA